jgi:hypothetical protein
VPRRTKSPWSHSGLSGSYRCGSLATTHTSPTG